MYGLRERLRVNYHYSSNLRVCLYQGLLQELYSVSPTIFFMEVAGTVLTSLWDSERAYVGSETGPIFAYPCRIRRVIDVVN